MASGTLIRTVRAVAALKPFSLGHTEHYVPEGSTILGALRAFGDITPGLSYTAAVDGEPVEVVDWFSRRLKYGETLALGCAPTGGGGNPGKDILKNVLSLAAIAGALAAGGPIAGYLGIAGKFGTLAVKGGLIAAGSALVNWMVPNPPTDEIDTPSIAPVLNARNVLKAYAPIPNIYGRMRVYPMHAALPHIDWHGQDGYVTYLFVIGYGYLEVETDSLRFSDTAFGDITGIEYEILPGSSSDADRTLYPLLDNTEDLTEWLTLDTWSSIEYTVENTDEFVCEVTFPHGFYWLTGVGMPSAVPAPARVQVQARLHSPQGSWSIVADVTRAGSSGAAFVVGPSVSDLPDGQDQYDVQVRVFTPAPPASDPDVTVNGSPRWTLLRSYNRADPISCDSGPNPKYVATIGVKVPITQTGIDSGEDGEPINPVDPRFNCIVKRRLMIWDDIGGWSGPTYTNNPAWAYVDLLKGQSNNRPVADAQIDLVTIRLWGVWCDQVVSGQDRWTCHGLFDRQRTVHQNLNAVASCGQASFFIADNKYSVIWDYERSSPDNFDVVQHITPRNSWGFSASKVFPPEIHGLRVKYLNPTEEWVVDEVTVYYTGYTSANATKFETVEFWGCADDEEAWRHGRYMLGDAQLRLQTIQVSMDIEHLVCQRGDLVQVTHDVPMHGLGFARVESKTEDPGPPIKVTHITVDDAFYILASGTYAVRTRRTSDGDSLLKMIVNPGSSDWYDTVEYSTPFGTSGIEIGDLVQFGKWSPGVSAPYLVAHIEPTGDLHARLTLIEYDTGVYSYGAIPAYSSNVTTPPDIERMGPGTPVIVAIQSDEAVLYRDLSGTLLPQIAVTITHPVGEYLPPHMIHIQHRERVEDPPNDDILTAWSATEIFGIDTGTVYVKGVVQGHIYDVRLRAISANHRPSPWVVCTDDTYAQLEVVGKSTPPPPPESLTMEETLLRWAYDEDTKPVDFAGFEVRHHQGSTPQWIYATKLRKGYTTGTSFSVNLSVGGEHTFYVKAVDTSGNYSNQSASLTVEFPEPEIENQAYQRDHTSVGFYSITGGEQLPDGTYRATGSPGNWNEMTVTSSIFTYGVDPSLADVIYLWINTHTVTASTYRFEHRQHPLGGEGDPGPWLAWTGKIITSGASELNKGMQLRAITAGGTIQGHITAWFTTIMWPTKREVLSSVAVTTLQGKLLGPLLTKQFSVVTAANLTIHSGGDALSWILLDHDPSNLHVALKDAAGEYALGTIDAEIVGYYNAQ